VKKMPATEGNAVVMPRSEKHYHVIVTQQMHQALKMYASKHHLSVCSATTRLLQLGFTAELSRQDVQKHPGVVEINKLIKDLAKQSLK